MKKSFILAMAALGTVPSIQAEPIDFSKISAQANWVLPAAVEALNKSGTGSFIISKLKENPEAAKGIAMLNVVFGLDVDAIEHVAIFGRGEANKGILTAKGGFDAERLEAMLAANASYVAKKHGDTVIHLIDQGTAHPKAIAFTGKDEMVASNVTKFTEHGIEVINGKEASLQKKGIYHAITNALPHPMLVGAMNVKGVAEFNKRVQGPEAVLIQKTDAIGIAVSETGGMIMVATLLQAYDEETAVHVENVARGLTSLLALGSDIDPDLAALLSRTKTKVSRKGKIISIELGIEVDTVKEVIASEMAKNKITKEKTDF